MGANLLTQAATKTEILINFNKAVMNADRGTADLQTQFALCTGFLVNLHDARKLIRLGAERILLLGMARDRARAARVTETVDRGHHDRVVNLCGKTAIGDLPHVLNECAVLLSSDTGTLQLAAATSTRPVGLFFGGENPVETGAFKPGAIALTLADPISGIVPNGAAFKPDAVAEVAMLAAEDVDFAKEYTNDHGFSMFLARSAPVAPEYTPLGIGSELEAALRRRRAEARAFIWGWQQERDDLHRSGDDRRKTQSAADVGLRRAETLPA